MEGKETKKLEPLPWAKRPKLSVAPGTTEDEHQKVYRALEQKAMLYKKLEKGEPVANPDDLLVDFGKKPIRREEPFEIKTGGQPAGPSLPFVKDLRALGVSHYKFSMDLLEKRRQLSELSELRGGTIVARTKAKLIREAREEQKKRRLEVVQQRREILKKSGCEMGADISCIVHKEED